VSALSELAASRNLWALFGVVGSVVFYGRFYVQWLASEREKRSVVPIAFWYMSSIGSLMVFVYAVYRRSPGAAFGQCFNTVVYARNLIHIWRERGRLSARLSLAVHAGAGLIVATATVFMALTWLREYHTNQALPAAEAARNWLWLGVWGVGQGCFFLRFFIQWLTTEMKRKSVVPPVFWYLSLAGAILQSASFCQRHDWILAAGMAATILIYARNVWFIRTNPNGEAPA